MKNVFRLGYIVIPFLFLISTTAYPDSHQKPGSRSPASLTSEKKLRLSDLSALDGITRSTNLTSAHPSSYKVSSTDQFKAATPPLGRGMGVEAPVLRFK